MTTTEAPTLAGRIATADTDAAEFRQRAGQLEDALNRAVAVGDYAQAEALQAQLRAVHEQMTAADATLAALRAGQAAAAQRDAAVTQAIAEARQHEQAENDLAAARADQARGRAQVAEAIDSMWAAIAAAQRALQTARSFEEAVNGAGVRQIDARRRLGEFGNDPGPTPARMNTTTVLADRHRLISELASWRP
jgi:chromosome segregation ATPase